MMSKVCVFNEHRESKDAAKIEWARFSWNPITGCKNECPYCFARDFAHRFYPQGFEPTFHKERLSAPYNTKLPKIIKNPSDKCVFVGSMGDTFGSWVSEGWINKVLKVCADTLMWNYLFLTKNPGRYLEFNFPENAWLGTTIDVKARLKMAQHVFKKLNKTPVRFISFEPLEEDIGVPDLSMFNWIIIGGRSASSKLPAAQPQWNWVENLLLAARKSNCNVYFKPNLLVRPKEYPEGI
jgi:protein gp37